jgi:drug/metabolite transporter (DMT)-like permease
MQILIFSFLCIVWGTTWIAIKISLEGLPPLLGASLRFSIAITILFFFIRIKGINIRVGFKNFCLIFLSSILMYTLDYGLIYWGEQYLSAGVTAIFFATFPIFTGLWATFYFPDERFRWNKFLGLLLGFLGIIFVFYDQLILAKFDKMVVLASGAIILAAAGGALSVVIVKKYLIKLNPITLTFNQMIYGIITLFVISIIIEDTSQLKMDGRVWIAVLYLGIIGSALAFVLYYWLLQQLSPITLSLIIYITPLIALFVDYLVFEEIIQPRAFLGTIIIFSGIALTQLNFKRAKKRKQKYHLYSETDIK